MYISPIMSKRLYLCVVGKTVVMAKKTVKARGREGTVTMDLSIPASVTREFDINRGDVFSVETSTDDKGRVVLEYTRVYDGE